MLTSLRHKFIAAMLLTSMVSIALVIGVAYTRLTHKFDDLAMQNAVQGFRGDVVAYFHAYGTWQQAQLHEDFPSFSDRRRQQCGLSLIRGLDPNRFPERAQDTELAPLTTGAAPPSGENLRRPPFRFYLFDTKWRALLALEPYHYGEAIHPDLHKQILPIESNGKLLAYFSPEGHAYYSDLDLGYLSAIREAMIFGTAAATVLALLLGLTLGNQLSGAILKLTTAIKGMEQGDLKQHVEVSSNDEVELLANSFNRMSDELVRSHEELRQAHQQVQAQAEQLKELSVRDDLTKLHNRRFFDEQTRALFNQAVRYHRPLTVMVGDLDFFKRINDGFSHAMGDEVLRRVGSILRGHVRAADVVARYGGEEFVIAFPETSLQQALVVCENLRRQIEQYPWAELHPDLGVTMSMGLCGNIDAGTPDAMLTAADSSLHLAKLTGRNRICVETEDPAKGTPTNISSPAQ
jgi:two-component system, cell cycle response regulator